MSKKTSKTLKSALNQVVSSLQDKTTSQVLQPLRSRRRRARRRRQNSLTLYRPSTVNSSWGRSLPAAYATHIRPRFNILARTLNSVRVSGCDLVYPLPNGVVSGTDVLFSIITCNPAYWTGTRIAQFAPAYMNYRPISLTFSYIPQVAVTQSGTVFMGTLWNGAAPSTNIQQTLFTSNGGCLTQCYVPCDTTIMLGANLPQNLFTLSGAISPETSPFLFMAGVRGATVVPGYFYVTYTFEFKNPIGQTWFYGRSEVTTYDQLKPSSRNQNSSLVLLDQTGSLGPGTVLDMESTGTYYNGSPYPITTSTRVIQFYNSQQAGPTNEIIGVQIGQDLVSLSQFTYLPPGTDLAAGKYVLITHYHDSDPDFQIGFRTYTATSGSDVDDGQRWYYPMTGSQFSLYSKDGIEVSGSEVYIPLSNVQEDLLANFDPDFTTSSAKSVIVSKETGSSTD